MSPLYAEVLRFCLAQRAALAHRPLIVGVQGPQGAGKSTLTRALIEALPAQGLTGLTVSIDDFYLTRSEQLAIAAAHPGNPYLEHRGYPGTHDVALGERTLAEIAGRGTEAGHRLTVDGQRLADDGGRLVRVPRYDKSAHAGRGDRAPESEWGSIELPIDLVFVEGWMLGFTPVDEATLSDEHLVPANRALAEYQRWYQHIDVWVVLRALDPNYVLTWRVEAEERMKASGKPGLSREDIEDYIRRFLPAYRTWGGAPSHVAADKKIEISVSLSREMA